MSRVGTAKERSVFVGNIPYDVTEEMLREIFSEAGQVINFRLVTDRDTGKPKGYGFCEYADGATALSAMRNLNGYEINGRNLRVDFADGGERTGGGGSGGGGGSSDKGPYSGVSGETFVTAIENAIRQFGPVKLYDLLVVLKEHARQKPEVTKNILSANPALAHAIVQCFRTLLIRMSDQPSLLSAPHPGGPVPSRSPVNGAGGILGMAPPGPPIALGQPPMRMPPPQTLSAVPPPPMGQPRPISPPPPVSSTRARDPRARARDPRKRSSEPIDMDSSKRSRSDPSNVPNSAAPAIDPIAELARHMTPEKLNLLPPNERQMLIDYMHSHGLSI